MSVHEGDLVLRPDIRTGLIVLAAAVVAGLGIVAAILLGDAPTVFAPIVGALFTALAVLAVGGILRARIILTRQEIVVRGLFSQQHRPRSHVAEIIRASIITPRGASSESLFLLDARRDLLIRVSDSGFKRDALDLLVAELGVPCTALGHPVEPKKFAKAYPGLITKVEQHPYRLAFAGFAIICAVVALTAAFLSKTS